MRLLLLLLRQREYVEQHVQIGVWVCFILGGARLRSTEGKL